MNLRLVLLAAIVSGLVLVLCVALARQTPTEPPTALGNSQEKALVLEGPSSADIVAKPSVQEGSRTASVESDDSAQLRVSVVDIEGVPQVGVNMYLHHGAPPCVKTKTNELGIAVFPVPDEDSQVLALAGSRFRARGSVARGARSARLVSPNSSRLRGRVLVDGEAPPALLLVGAHYEEAPNGPIELSKSEAYAITWERPLRGPAWETTITDEDGWFQFIGLDPTWDLQLAVESWFWKPEVPPAKRFRVQDSPVELRLISLPTLRGRVVRAGSREPVAGCIGACEIECADGSRTSGVTTSDDGRFRVPLGCFPVHSAKLQLSSPGLGSLELDVPQIPDAGLDLGDLVLDPITPVTVLVHDRNGQPIRGAHARRPSEPLGLRDTTDARGIARLDVPATGQQRLRIEALGFVAVEFDIDPSTVSPAEPVDVELAALPALRLRLDSKGIEYRGGLLVQLVCESAEPFREGFLRHAAPIQTDLGAPSSPRRRSWPAADGEAARTTLDYALIPGEELLTIPGLDPAVPIRALLLDATEHVLDESVVTPADFESGEPITLVLDRRPGGLRIRVEDPSGLALPATLTVGTMSASTAKSGSGAELYPIWAESVSVVARSPGFAPRQFTIAVSAGTWRDEVIALEPGRSLAVRAVDSQGKSVPVGATIVRMDGHDVGQHVDLPDGSARIDDLPNTPLDLYARVGDVWVIRHVSAVELDIVLEAP